MKILKTRKKIFEREREIGLCLSYWQTLLLNYSANMTPEKPHTTLVICDNMKERNKEHTRKNVNVIMCIIIFYSKL